MSISAISPNSLSQVLLETQQSRSVSSTRNKPFVDSLPTDSASGVSSFGQMYSKLESLAASSPGKFKQLTASIAGQFKEAAGKAQSPLSDLLNSLAERFEKASESGKASDLQPPEAVGTARAHRNHGYQQSSEGSDPTSLQSLFAMIFQQVQQA